MEGGVTRACLGKRPGHQAAIAPSGVRAPEAFGVAVRGIGLIKQSGDQSAGVGGGCEQACGLKQIAGKAAAHGQSAAVMVWNGPLP